MRKYYPTILGALCLVLAIAVYIADRTGLPPPTGFTVPASMSAVSPTATPVSGSPTRATAGSPANAALQAHVSGGVGSVFVPPAAVLDLPVYYDMSSTTDVIRVASPSQGNGVSSPLSVTGSARGPWFFEGSFSIVLTNTRGVILAKGTVAAQGDWQTADFVPFSGVLAFSKQQSDSTGFIYFLKDNPSGLASNAEAAVVPIIFQ